MIGRTTAAALCAGLLLVNAPCHAVEGESLADRTGKWTFTMNEPGADMKKLGAGRLKAIRENLQSLARQITALPAMSPPKGFEARFWGSASGRDRFDICSGKKCPPSRPNGVLALMIGSYVETDGKVKAAFNKAATMDVGINNLGHVFSSLPVLYRDRDGFLLPEPQRDGERAGMPAYLNNGHVVAVLSRSSVPMWLPVTRERYLQAAIDDLARDLGLPVEAETKGKKGKPADIPRRYNKGNPIIKEEGRSWIDPASQQMWVEKSRSLGTDLKESADLLAGKMRALQEELAALTPEQRLQQARIEMAPQPDGESYRLLPVDSNDGRAVVTPNFEFFNRKLPLDAVQLLTIQWKFDGGPVFDPEKPGISESLHNSRLLEIYKGLDWLKLAEKLPLR